MERSFVDQNNRSQFLSTLDYCGKGSKIFSSYQSSVLMQPLLGNIKDVSDRVNMWTSCWNSTFSNANPTPCRSGFHTILLRITIGIALSLNMLAKYSRTNKESFTVFILSWYCFSLVTPIPYAVAAIKSTFLHVPSWLSFPVKSNSDPYPGFL